MTTARKRERISPVFLMLAVITLALSSWGLFTLARLGGMPAELAVLTVAGLDLAAVGFGKHALTVAEDGDSSLPWNVGLLALTGLGAYAQLSVHLLRHDALAFGLVSMAFPIVTVALFEGQLRRRFRLQGRRTGRVAPPRASVDLMTWIFYPALAIRATKLAVLDRGMTPDTAVMIASGQLALERAEEERPVPARRMRRTYAAELAAAGAVELDVHTPPSLSAGPADVEGPDVPDTERTAPSDVRRRGEIAAAVRTAREEHGDDLDLVLGAVREIHPAAERETVRRTLSRLAQ